MVSTVDIRNNNRKHSIMSNSTEVKRGRGRPKSFPNAETRMAGFNLPVATLEKIVAAAAKRGTNQNTLLDRAVNAYLRKS